MKPRIQIDVYRTALLRGTGFDVGPLLRVGSARPDGDHGAALDHGLRVLREAFSDPRLVEAVSISNPAFHDIAFADGRALRTDTPYAGLDKHGRRQVRTAHRYLRRLLGKTETNSFFGPTLACAFDPEVERGMVIGTPRPEDCTVGLSHWVVTEIAASLRRRKPAADRWWSRDPLWRQDGDRLVHVLTGRVIELDTDATLTWKRLLDPRPAVDAGPGLHALAPALRPWPQPPATLGNGVAWLRSTYPDADLPRQLATSLAAVRDTPWPGAHRARADLRQLVAGAGVATTRSAGAHYADRDVLNEDRSSPYSGAVTFGRPAVNALHDALAQIGPLMLLAALLRQQDARVAVRRAVASGTNGLVELAARDIEPVTDGMDALVRVIDAMVPDDPDVDTAYLEPALLEPLWALVAPVPDDLPACLPGFDLMLAGGPPGTGQWVLSECHDDSSSALGGITVRAQPDGGGYGQFCDVVAGAVDTDRMATVIGRRRSRHITPELPGLSIELSGVSTKPPREVAAAADVTVSPTGDRVRHAGRSYQLYPGDIGSVLFTAVSLPQVVPVPFATGRAYTPRIVLGGVVVQRRRYRIDLPAVGRGRSAWVAAEAWRARHRMPHRVYLRHPDEPKPLLIDFTDPYGVDDLTRLRPGPVVCTEVLPALSDTWWRADGRQPAELRIPVFLRWSW